MKITLPYPPSANRYWRHAQGRTYRSAEAVEYINTVGQLCMVERVRPTAEPVRVSVRVYRPQRSGDLDNCLKVLLDSLRGYAYLDDKQIVELHAYRSDDKASPRVEVEVEAC